MCKKFAIETGSYKQQTRPALLLSLKTAKNEKSGQTKVTAFYWAISIVYMGAPASVKRAAVLPTTDGDDYSELWRTLRRR